MLLYINKILTRTVLLLGPGMVGTVSNGVWGIMEVSPPSQGQAGSRTIWGVVVPNWGSNWQSNGTCIKQSDWVGEF